MSLPTRVQMVSAAARFAGLEPPTVLPACAWRVRASAPVVPVRNPPTELLQESSRSRQEIPLPSAVPIHQRPGHGPADSLPRPSSPGPPSRGMRKGSDSRQDPQDLAEKLRAEAIGRHTHGPAALLLTEQTNLFRLPAGTSPT